MISELISISEKLVLTEINVNSLRLSQSHGLNNKKITGLNSYKSITEAQHG